MSKKSIVYRSKNEEDWNKAVELLKGAGLEFAQYATEEIPVGGCGAKLDPRKVVNNWSIPTKVYRIEVEKADESAAAEVLRGKVQPVLSYGVGI